MNIKITTATSLSIGGSTVTNVVGYFTQNLKQNAQNELTGSVNLEWYLSSTDKNADKDPVWILDNNGKKITTAFITLTAQETAAAGLPVTIYNKVAEAVEAMITGSTVVVE